MPAAAVRRLGECLGQLAAGVGRVDLLVDHADLDAAVPQFWFEIAQSIGALEAAAEDEASPHRELASLVASKVD